MRSTLLLILMLWLSACGGTGKEEATNSVKATATTRPASKYPEHVGDIAYDEAIDSPDFEPCQSQIPQYYALGADFRVDNDVLLSHFESVPTSEVSALTYHTIRFIVNCKGQIGRLRIETMDADYQATVLNPQVAEAIKARLAAFDQWPKGRDFYQYLTFKIEGGKIKEVLP